MQHAIRLRCLLAAIGVGALIAGCGQTTGSPGSPQAGATSSATSGASGQLTSGQVTLTLDKQRYKPGDTVTATIHNGLSKAIWAEDHQTNCTVVTAEHLQDGQWQAVGRCRLMTPTIMMPLAAGSATVQRLFGAGWSGGLYRLTLTYTGGDEGAGGPGGVVHSAEFTIG